LGAVVTKEGVGCEHCAAGASRNRFDAYHRRYALHLLGDLHSLTVTHSKGGQVVPGKGRTSERHRATSADKVQIIHRRTKFTASRYIAQCADIESFQS
jgi:hypothetical protein